MKTDMIYTALISSALFISSCTEINPEYVSKPEEDMTPDRTEFALGADISWITQMESEGIAFYNKSGVETECTALMKETGMNSIRLRVWVDPEDGWSNAGDVLVKALRAQKLGMRIMINFHYSDTWADPGHQTVPAAWAEYDIDRLKNAVSEHTAAVLQTLKDRNVAVEWVQVGNETRDGMMWPLGRASEYPGNYAELTTAGYDAVKSVYPEAKVIVHIDGGNWINNFTYIFDILYNNKGKYDMIGMSLYPYSEEAAEANPDSYWKKPVEDCIANITTLSQKYGCDVMICETGMPYDDEDTAYAMLSALIAGAKATGHCSGVFYWEPEAPAGYNNGYTLGAFENNMPTHALDAFTEAAAK